MKTPKILYFIKGFSPSKDDIKKAESIENNKVCFRNVNYIDPNGSIEQCDFVLGEAPKNYLRKYPVYGSEKVEIELEPEIENKPLPAWKPN